MNFGAKWKVWRKSNNNNEEREESKKIVIRYEWNNKMDENETKYSIRVEHFDRFVSHNYLLYTACTENIYFFG